MKEEAKKKSIARIRNMSDSEPDFSSIDGESRERKKELFIANFSVKENRRIESESESVSVSCYESDNREE